MPRARLLEIYLKNFKSFGPEGQRIGLRPLTVILGRNNSGKSTIIQGLLLLKQTLADPRAEVRLKPRNGYLEALDLRELTHGWPERMDEHGGDGPWFEFTWESEVDPHLALHTGRRPIASQSIAKEFKLGWLREGPGPIRLTTTLALNFTQVESRIRLCRIILRSRASEGENPGLEIEWQPERSWYSARWSDVGEVPGVQVELDHFLPFLTPGEYASAPNAKARLRLAGFRLLYEQPLRDFNELLLNLQFLGSSRQEPRPTYPKPSSDPNQSGAPGIRSRDVGRSGEHAPELLYEHQESLVHYAPLGLLQNNIYEFPPGIRERPLKEAFSDILHELDIDLDLSFEDVGGISDFKLLLGRAALPHVGRGIGYVLPLIVAGLITDPLAGPDKFSSNLDSIAEYLKWCQLYPILAIEEAEGHLHPKVQARLAHLMVALARAGRQLLIETHSDHLVRRLRRLIASAKEGSDTEKWLAENIAIIEVEQQKGITHVRQEHLTRGGDIESWPAGFMDEAPDEEREIYFARMDKQPPSPPSAEAEFREGLPEGPADG